MTVLSSKDNPRVKRWARLVDDARYRRSEGRLIAEGPHLAASALEAGWKPEAIVVAEPALGKQDIASLVKRAGGDPVVVSEGVMKAVVDSETPQGIALELRIPAARKVKESAVFLEGVQDAGNVGAILRSAAAFGIRSAVLDKACADPWSPKVLRAGAGAHFVLSLTQVSSLAQEMEVFPGKTISTVIEGGTAISEAELSGTIGWIFGSEGQGVSSALQQGSDLRVRIPMARGTQSLNVAAAAAICFYQAALSRSGAGS